MLNRFVTVLWSNMFIRGRCIMQTPNEIVLEVGTGAIAYHYSRIPLERAQIIRVG